MNVFGKNYYIITLLGFILLSCSTPEEQRLNAIASLLSENTEGESYVEIINVDYDSLYSIQRNVGYVDEVKKIMLLRDSTIHLLTEFKSKYADENCRVWLNNVGEELNSSYNEIIKMNEQLRLLIVDLASKCNTDPMIGNLQQSIVLQYKANGLTKYGLFIFTSNNDISDYITFSENEYATINTILTKSQINALQYIPTFETIGVDIVPEEEDPSKSKEERELIKAEQAAKLQAEHIAYMKRTNPISKTFYGATLGRTSINNILRNLKNEGWKVTQLSNGAYSEYYCSGWRDFIEGLSYNVIRVYAHNGILYKIEFIDDYTPEWDAKKRFFDSEIKDALHNAKASASKKYGFWNQGYNNDKFDDGTTVLSIENYGNCVSYVFEKHDK